MKKIHPAVAQHAMEENEKLRGLLRELREITSEYAWDADLEARVDAALTQQADPAPEQDEREAFEAWARDHLPGTQERFPNGVYRDWSIECAWQGYQARPAQTEQQPVSWQFYQNGKWWNGDARIKDHRKNTEAAGIPVRDLYAAPIAQTAPQHDSDCSTNNRGVPDLLGPCDCSLSGDGQ